MLRDASRARSRRNGTPNVNLATIVRKLGVYNKVFKGAACDHHEYPKTELLILNKEQEEEISRLEIQVEKLKDLCMKQREEIKSLQSTILFPDSSSITSSQHISILQRQLASLEGRLQSLAHDVAEVKAEKYSGRGIFDHQFSFQTTSLYDRGDGAKPRFDQVYTSAHYAVSEQDDKCAN